MMPTQTERESVANWTRGYEEGYAEAFEDGFDVGVRAAKQKLLTFFKDEDELPESINAWLQT